MAGIILAREHDDNPGIAWDGGVLTHREAVALAAQRGAWLKSVRQPGRPFHVGILADNSVDYLLWLEATALVGAVLVGGNTTHRGEELARDLSHTECQILLVAEQYFALVDGHDLGDAIGTVSRDNPRVVVMESSEEAVLLEPFAGVSASDVVDPDITPGTLGYLIFTSGTSGAPKAVKCSQGRMAGVANVLPLMFSLTSDDVFYCAMPLFHSNALMANWGAYLVAGATQVIPTSGGRFSASGFLPDVRRFGVTYFNYVGKPLSYILATPEQPDDADNPLRQCFGNEAAIDDIEKFARRFGCLVTDGYGSSEGGANVSRTPDSPPGSLGRAPEGTVVLNPETGEECPPARFDDNGVLLNADECIGEMVSKPGGQTFEGYWRNDDASRDRLKNGWYWTGDLAYRDELGFFYFAGRNSDWLRVDGENFAAAPVEQVLGRNANIVLAAVYAVPDEHVGDQVMAAIELAGEAFDPDEFAAFLASQEDLGTKWAPKYVRVTRDLPKTATSKVLKQSLRTERWNCDDVVYWRRGKELAYELLGDEDRAALNEATKDRLI